ncbi:MAG TPA: hypothetical protein VNS55_07075 [Nocardioides sp.]|nr:hypothetical protein [Nocardioides sp.]
MSDGPVYLHVGLKKTGTSYLQSILRANTEALEAQGLSMVPHNQVASRQLVRALKGQLEEGVDAPRAKRALVRFPRELAEAPGDRVLVSDEVFGGSTPEQVERLGEALGGREAHLLLTVRDIARTIPSAWQQTIKGGSRFPYERYVDAVVARDGDVANAFWHSYDVPALLERWRGLVAPERMHVVLLPPPGAAPTVLLDRFCGVLGIDPASLTAETVRANESLGRAQAELLRRLNGELAEATFRRDLHGPVLKRGFAIGVLAPQKGDRIPMPAGHRAWCEEHAEGVIEALVRGGYDIVGDVAELRPHESAFAEELEPITDEQVADAAVRALAVLLDGQVEDLRQEREAARAARAERRERG